LYDTPSEEWEAAGGGSGVPPARDSRLPRHDERPADEYDQPWEWKKDHISRAFAAPVGTTAGPQHPAAPVGTTSVPHVPAAMGASPGSQESPSTPGYHHGVPPAPMGTPPAPKHPPVPMGTSPGSPNPASHSSHGYHSWLPASSSTLGPGCPPSPRHVDTSLPLEKQAWYHGPIGRAGAETLLALCREGSFLVRDCETSPDDYSLSSHGFVHVKLTRTREQHFTLGRAGAAFPSVPAAVRHYTARALPVRGARHLALLYPVAVQPL
ncbi:SHF protein, partial [Furnarius figulus]|nr:SHF protein [Furnarius figulus]